MHAGGASNYFLSCSYRLTPIEIGLFEALSRARPLVSITLVFQKPIRTNNTEGRNIFAVKGHGYLLAGLEKPARYGVSSGERQYSDPLLDARVAILAQN